jgi:hypothetical protein
MSCRLTEECGLEARSTTSILLSIARPKNTTEAGLAATHGDSAAEIDSHVAGLPQREQSDPRPKNRDDRQHDEELLPKGEPSTPPTAEPPQEIDRLSFIRRVTHDACRQGL